MHYYQAPDQSLHALEDAAYAHILPAGSVEISTAQYAVLTAPPPPENAALVADKLAQVRTLREAMLNRMTGIALVAQLNGDTATVDGFKVARQGLLDITTGCPTDPALVDAFIQAKYAAILSVLPATLVKAFAGVDA